MRITTLLVALLFASVSLADVPPQLKRTAGKNSARALLKQCSSSEDTLRCLTERGAECLPVADQPVETHRCALQITLEASKRAGSRPPELIGRYDVVYLVTMSRKGWRGKTESVKRQKD